MREQIFLGNRWEIYSMSMIIQNLKLGDHYSRVFSYVFHRNPYPIFPHDKDIISYVASKQRMTNTKYDNFIDTGNLLNLNEVCNHIPLIDKCKR